MIGDLHMSYVAQEYNTHLSMATIYVDTRYNKSGFRLNLTKWKLIAINRNQIKVLRYVVMNYSERYNKSYERKYMINEGSKWSLDKIIILSRSNEWLVNGTQKYN